MVNTNICIVLPTELAEQVRAYAKKNDMPISNIFRQGVRGFLKNGK